MAAISWNGISGDWTNAADWSGGVVPGAADTATLGGSGAYTVTLYSTAAIGGLIMNAPGALFYDAGLLTLGGVFALQAGTFALAYGTLQGGTLALAGGTLQASGGTLDGVAVQGTLTLGQPDATLFVKDGLTAAGTGGAGSGTIAITGGYAALDFLGSQALTNAVVNLGATGPGPGQGGAASLAVSHAYGATSGATLTLAASTWLRETGTQGQLTAGAGLPGPVTDAIVNLGTITNATTGGTLTLAGPGLVDNAGLISVSNGATLDIASAAFANTGTMLVSNATLDLGGTFAATRLAALGPLTLSAATVEIGGDAINTGTTLAIGNATPLGPLLLAGTITGGTLADSGGGLTLSTGTGVLDCVAYTGALILGANTGLTLADSTTLANAGGPGTASITGANATLLLEGLLTPQTTLNNATLSLGSSTGIATIGTADPWLASAATTATLGPALLIEQTGKFAAIDANATTPIAGYGLSDTLVNQGSITASFAGGTLTLGGAGLFINQGSIAVSNADTLVMDTAGFSNTGSITISGGATAILGGPPNAFGQSPAWSNTGQITLNGGSLVLSGLMQTAQLGHITDIAGGITLAGTLANAGATLSLGTPGMLATLSLTGTIQGGTITDPAGLLSAGTAGTALLDSVTDTGTLALTQAGAWLRIRNFLTLNGSAEITGAGAVLGFQGSQIFNNAQIMLGAAGQAATLDVLHDSTTTAPSTLTLGAGLTIAEAGALAAIGAPTDRAGDGITSYATITAATAGGTLALGGSNFINRGRIQVSNAGTLALTAAQFTNTGTIAITNASLDIADSLSTASLGSLTLTNAAIAIGGTLANTGTLAIGAGSAWGRLSLTGTITGGTIADSGGGLNAAGGATLNGVAYQGLLDLSRPFQQLATENGLAVTNLGGSGAGTIMLTGAASRLLATSSETLNNATIYLGSPTQTYYGQPIAPPELAASAGTTLTLGAGLKIQSAGLVGWLGNFATGNWTDAIVNDGTILAATAQGILTLGSSAFTNAGGLSIGNGGNIMFAGVSMQNTGNISLAAGSSLMLSLYGYYAAPNAGPTVFTNSGTLHMLGGAFQELTGNGLFPSVAIVNAAGGLIQGLGNILAPIVNNGTIEGKFGPNLSITGAITGTGTLQVDAGCVLELGNAVTASQTLAFTGAGETARLDDPQFFAAHVTGFTSGDTIDMAGSQINTVAVSAGTLVLGTTYGQFRLATTTPLGGEFSVGADTHGGDLVSYVQQTPGSGGAGGGTITTIAVTQPKMLFWASPVGDVFTGASAAMQGANIANWTAADSLDITDLLGAQTRIAYAQATGQGTITVTDGTHTDTVTLLGSYNASWFHVTPDAHGGALVTYSQT